MVTVDGKDEIIWSKEACKWRFSATPEENGNLIDFAIVQRDKNPDAQDKTWLILAGCSAFGTSGAAVWLDKQGSRWFGPDSKYIRQKRPVQSVLKVEVRDYKILSVKRAVPENDGQPFSVTNEAL